MQPEPPQRALLATQMLRTQLIPNCFSKENTQLRTAVRLMLVFVPWQGAADSQLCPLCGHSPSPHALRLSTLCSTLKKNECRALEEGFESVRKRCQAGQQGSVLSAAPHPAPTGSHSEHNLFLRATKTLVLKDKNAGRNRSLIPNLKLLSVSLKPFPFPFLFSYCSIYCTDLSKSPRSLKDTQVRREII